MKRRIFTLSLLFILFFQNNSIAQFQWEDVSPFYPVNNDPFGLGFYVVDEDIAWSIPFWLNGEINPKISKTTDGGDSWDIYSELKISKIVDENILVNSADKILTWTFSCSISKLQKWVSKIKD